jgi:flagellum-specific peptidoglycan hydrolase FlgJ
MSSTQELNKICNIAGYPMYSWAIAQLRKRSEILSKPTRSEEEINYLGNKGAWIRVVSSVNLEASFLKYFKDQYGIDGNESTLAKNFILFGGTSTYESGLRSGINQGPTYASGGSYGILGSTEVKEYGYRPMPGITSVTIESAGRMGSVRQATVNFRVSDKMQLDVMDALYFRPGFTLLIEYGHAKYIDNKGSLQSTETLMIDPFKITNKENIGIEISRKIQQSAGNYGGMLSVITSFNFSITADGGYDCVLKTIAMGGVMGNYPINNLSILPNVYVETVQKYINNQKEIQIKAAREAAEAAKADAIAKVKKSVGDNWTDLKKTDALANLIYNLKPDWYVIQDAVINQNNFKTYSSILVDDAVLQYRAPTTGVESVFKIKNNNITAYAVDEAIFIESSPFSNISNKYLAAGDYSKQKGLGDIYVYVDPSTISDLFFNGSLLDENSKPVYESRADFRFRYLNWVRAIDAAPDKYIIYFRNTDEQKALPKDQRTKYFIGIEYGNDIPLETAEKIYLNLDTEWKVVKTDANIPYVTLETIDKLRTYRLYIGQPMGVNRVQGDLSFINNVIVKGTNQDLTKNKPAEEIIEIESQTAKSVADIANQFALDASAKTLKAIANSQSALELMLRSILIYAISDLGKTPMRPKFIKELFSEGAYSDIFKNGIPATKKYTSDDFTRYINGTMNAKDRLEVNLRYGNSAYLMSAENTSNNINLLDIIPQVDIKSMFNIITVPYGETADTLIEGDNTQRSVYISLGLFFMMLNHTGMLYSSNDQDSVRVPVTYVDFNPSTNFYLSSINQFSIDPFKYIMPYYGTKDDYKKLFRKDILLNNDTIQLKLSGSPVQPHSIFKFGKGVDQITPVLPNNKKGVDGKIENGYIGRTMDTMVNINYLLKIIKTRSTADDFGEAYFQSILENIIASFNKSTGYYNALRLSYSDSANTFMIVDDHVQLKPDAALKTIIGEIINNSPNSPEIPIQGKGSIARSFDIRTDISNRIASMIAISTNPGIGNQVGMGKNTSDFGIYNTGSHDRYMKVKTSDGSSNATSTTATLPIQNNVQECQAAINFDTVVTAIYGLSNGTTTEYIKSDDVEQAAAYYKEKMSKVKNEQAGSVSAMIIPIKASITMDGFSGIYPFQLFTINENMLPYRYSSANLNNGKVAFSTAKLTHNFSNNEWVTSMEGFMTFLKESDDQQTKPVAASDTIVVSISTNRPIITKSKTDFVKTYYPIAKIAGEKSGIDPIIILAQAAQESGWGNSNLAQNYNNFFGITAGSSWTGKTYVAQNQFKLTFRVYDSPQASFDDFADLIKRRYKLAYTVAKDYKAYAYQISISPYITEENGDDRNVYQNNIINNYEAILAILKKENIN